MKMLKVGWADKNSQTVVFRKPKGASDANQTQQYVSIYSALLLVFLGMPRPIITTHIIITDINSTFFFTFAREIFMTLLDTIIRIGHKPHLQKLKIQLQQE